MNWIKMEAGLRTNPKVGRIARSLKSNRFAVFGGLFAVWCVFDEHSKGGFLEGYTFDDLDDDIGWPGFSITMATVGWLVDTGEGLQAPEYEEHNGPNAKRRATDAKRKETVRKTDKNYGGSSKGSGQMSACDADKKRTETGQQTEEDPPDTRTDVRSESANDPPDKRTSVRIASDEKQTRIEKRREEEEKGTDSSEEVAREEFPETEPEIRPSPSGTLCRALRKAGIQAVQSQHPTLLALLDAGATEQEFLDAAPKAIGKSDPFAYLLAMVEKRRKDAAEKAKSMPHGALGKTDDGGAANAERNVQATVSWTEEFKRRREESMSASSQEARKAAMARLHGGAA